jgi:arylsulfatase
LTGANHHSAGISGIAETETGLPNAAGGIKPEYGTIAEILKEYDYHTIAVGKWHLGTKRTRTAAGPFHNWPLGKGFDNYYGFLDAATDQWNPYLVRDNTPVQQPKKASEGYHLSADLTDNAIRYIYQFHNIYPNQPYFLYLAYGAMHAPLHAPKEYIDKYKGRFDDGWDKLREETFQRQKKLGIIPEDALLTGHNPLVQDWDDMSEDDKKAAVRLMEVYAGYLDYTDAQIGRLIDYLEESEQLEHTMIVLLSDNGASAEGGKNGYYNHYCNIDITKNVSETDLILEHYETVGDEFSSPHYPMGWSHAGNAPFQWYKVWVHEGGLRDPLIIHYPERIKDKGSVRRQFHHVSDITPTVLDVLGFEKPESIKGVHQQPLHGISMQYTFDDADAAGRKRIQYFEMYGNRGIYKDGWKAVTDHTFKKNYDEDIWELYHVENDYSESENVVEKYPEKLKELEEAWYAEAGRYGVFPLGPGSHIAGGNPEIQLEKIIPERVYQYKHVRYPLDIPETLEFANHSYRLKGKICRKEGNENGVLIANGDRFGGSVLYIHKNHLKFVYNYLNREHYTAVSDVEMPKGESTFELRFQVNESETAEALLLINHKQTGHVNVPHFNRLPTLMNTTLKADSHTEVSPEYEVPFEFTGEILEMEIHIAPFGITEKEILDSFFKED